MKTSKVFQHAKPYLAKSYAQINNSEKDQFICWALSEAWRRGHISQKDKLRAKDIIQDRLNIGKVRCSNLEVWLECNHGVKQLRYDASERTERRYVNKMQTTRHAWVDSLIAEFAAKGD